MSAPAQGASRTFHVIAMGVSGSGKSTVGALLAEQLGGEFLDGDDLHPAANVAKMAAGMADDLATTLLLATDTPVAVAPAMNRQMWSNAATQRNVATLHTDERVLARYLDEPDMPDVDLFLRTSGEQRTSNFLLWQIAYSEIWVTPTLWPDFRKVDFLRALRDYAGRQRRYGA